MDKAHVLRVCKFDDVETFMTMDEVFSEPIIDPFKQKEHLRSWLSDPQGRDMFSCLVGEEVILAWNNKAEKEEVDHSRKVCFVAAFLSCPLPGGHVDFWQLQY